MGFLGALLTRLAANAGAKVAGVSRRPFARRIAQEFDHIEALLAYPALAAEMAGRGQRAIFARHTCAHRVNELLTLCAQAKAARRKVAA